MENCCYVHLLFGENIVGFGKYFCGTNQSPNRQLHGKSLRDFAKDGEDLIAVNHVQIFKEFEEAPYPYNFHSLDGFPRVLGDLNRPEKYFKAIIAWDKRKTAVQTYGYDLGNTPQVVYTSEYVAGDQRSDELEESNDAEELERGDGQCDHRSRTESGELDLRTGQRRPRFDPSAQVDHPPRKRPFARRRLTGLPDNGSNPVRSVELAGSSAEGGSFAGPVNQGTTQSSMAPNTNLPDSEESSASDSDSSGTNWPKGKSFVVKRRAYIYRKRHPAAPKRISKLREHRLRLSKRADNPFQQESLECCKANCFDNIDKVDEFATYRRILPMSREQFTNELIKMYDSRRCFRFQGRKVCSRFLRFGFHFSACLQNSIKGNLSGKIKANRSASHREQRGDALRDLIINYLTKLAEDTGDKMPNKEEVHLPSTTKRQVFEDFIDHVLKVYPKNQKVPSMNYFYAIWKRWCPRIKTHRNHGFTVCSRCEMIRERMELAIGDSRRMELLRAERLTHLDAMRKERRDYMKRRDLSVTRPNWYYSIILDGADQKSYGLPHFFSAAKSDRGHKLKVKCVGVLEHLKKKCLNLFTMTEEFQSGANHVIEAAHRVIQKRKQIVGKLPPTLYVQADNCTRENKNRYFLSYFEMLVRKGVFVQVQVSCLPVGHTHTDIDQSFSSVAIHLRAQKAITMADLLDELRTCYSPKAEASEIQQVTNFSRLCETSGCLNDPFAFMHFRYFRFSRKEDIYGPEGYETICEVKVKCTDEWELMKTKEKRASFLKKMPTLHETPPTVTEPPDNLLEINRHFNSVEERIADEAKMEELRALRDRVYTRRTDPFHWYLTSVFEEQGDYFQGHGDTHSDSEDESELSAGDELRYEPGAYVAVRTNRQDSCQFWIARILNVEDRRTLLVRWYIVKGVENKFDGIYEVARLVGGVEPAPYDARIDRSMVLVYFESLTRQGKLRAAVKSAIRTTLDSN